MVTGDKGTVGAWTAQPVTQAFGVVTVMCAGIVLRDGGGSVAGGWLLPWLEPGFAVPGPSGADWGLSVAFVQNPSALQAALRATSSDNSAPKLWSKMFWARARRFLPAGSKRDCVFPRHGTKWWGWEAFQLLLYVLGVELVKSGWERRIVRAQAPVCSNSDQAWMAQ